MTVNQLLHGWITLAELTGEILRQRKIHRSCMRRRCLSPHSWIGPAPDFALVPHDDFVPVQRMDPATEARLRRAELTYPEVGRTRAQFPPGYHVLRLTRTVVGGSFAQSSAKLLSWQLHERAGIRVTAWSAQVEAGALVVLGLGIRSARVSAPCRVVYVVDEPTRRGFAYGTLTGHPESGEESFIVSLTDEGRVELTIGAYSKPASILAKLAGPVGRTVQQAVTRRYLRALDGE